MTVSQNLTLYRRTTEAWEIAVMEAMQVDRDEHTTGTYGKTMLKKKPDFNRAANTLINRITCSQLRSGKEIVLGHVPPPFAQLTEQEIEQGIVSRVGVETMIGTPNFYSHFVPCGTNPRKSAGYTNQKSNTVTKSDFYQFIIFGAIFPTVAAYWAERHTFTGTPLFQGEPEEVHAYTGTVIMSVRHCVSVGNPGMLRLTSTREVLNSLD